MYAACSDLAHRTCGEEVDGIEDGRDEMQAYAGLVGPIGCRGRVAQEQVVYCPDDEDRDESAKLPLHERQR